MGCSEEGFIFQKTGKIGASTFSIMKFGITTLSVLTHSLMGLLATLSKNYTQLTVSSFIILNVIMLNVVMLSVVMLSVTMLSVTMLSVTMLSVTMLSVTMLSVVAPKNYR